MQQEIPQHITIFKCTKYSCHSESETIDPFLPLAVKHALENRLLRLFSAPSGALLLCSADFVGLIIQYHGDQFHVSGLLHGFDIQLHVLRRDQLLAAHQSEQSGMGHGLINQLGGIGFYVFAVFPIAGITLTPPALCKTDRRVRAEENGQPRGI